MRAVAAGPRPPLTLRLVDWADEEGARFGRSLVGSSACAGTLDPESLRGLRDRDGVALPDALAARGVELDRMLEAGAELRRRGRLPRAAHRAGARAGEHRPAARRGERRLRPPAPPRGRPRRPRPRRRDADAPAPRRLPRPPRAARSPRARAPSAGRTRARPPAPWRWRPGIVTAFNGMCEFSLDQRAFDAGVLAEMVDEAREASQRIAAEEGMHRRVDPPVRPGAGLLRAGAGRDRRRRHRRTSPARSRPACRAARCTTPPRWRAWCRR